MNIEKDSSSLSSSTSIKLPSALLANSLDEITTEIHEIAEHHQGDPLSLLHLLRTLEQLHREIQQDYFQDALPNSRQALYALLRDIEENGGWPYVQRWKIQALFANLTETEK
jgi:hypothetical protein